LETTSHSIRDDGVFATRYRRKPIKHSDNHLHFSGFSAAKSIPFYVFWLYIQIFNISWGAYPSIPENLDFLARSWQEPGAWVGVPPDGGPGRPQKVETKGGFAHGS
jgi:hypothetical protein